MKKKLIFKILAVVSGLLLSVMMAEVIFRLCFEPKKSQDCDYVQREGYYVYPPLTTVKSKNEKSEQVFAEIDENGLRNQKGALEDARVIVLGDSYIIATNTPEEDTFVAQLRKGGVNAYNAGMNGFSTFHCYRLLKDLLKKSHPDKVILCFYLGNDFHDNYFDEIPVKQDSSINKNMSIEESGSSIYLYGIKKMIKNVLKKSRLLVYVVNNTRTYARGKTDIMMNYCLSEMESFRWSYNPPMLQALEKTKCSIFAIYNLLKERGIDFIIVGIPSKAQVAKSFYEISKFHYDETASTQLALELISQGFSFDRPDEILREIAKENGVPYVSLLNIYRQYGVDRMFYYIDSHWTPDGQRIGAEAVLKVIGSSPAR